MIELPGRRKTGNHRNFVVVAKDMRVGVAEEDVRDNVRWRCFN